MGWHDFWSNIFIFKQLRYQEVFPKYQIIVDVAISQAHYLELIL